MYLDTCLSIVLEHSQRRFSFDENGYLKGMNESLWKGDASGFSVYPISDLMVPHLLG